MAIEVKHGVSAGAVAAAAFGGAQNKARAELKKKQLDAMEKRNEAARQRAHQASQAAKDRKHSAEQAELSREYSEEQAAIGREHDIGKTKYGTRVQEERDARTAESRREEFDYRTEAGKTAAQEERDRVGEQLGLPAGKDPELWEMGYDQSAIAQAQKNMKAVEEDIATNKYSEEEAEDMRRQAAEAETSAGEKIPILRGKTPREQFDASTYTDRAGNVHRLVDGGVGDKPIITAPQRGTDQADAMSKALKNEQMLISLATEEEMVKDPKTGKMIGTGATFVNEEYKEELRAKFGASGVQEEAVVDPQEGDIQAQAAEQQQEPTVDTKATIGVEKPQKVASIPEASKQWDDAGQLIQEMGRQIGAIQGSPDAVDLTNRGPVDEIRDVATGVWRLENADDDMKKWLDENPKLAFGASGRDKIIWDREKKAKEGEKAAIKKRLDALRSEASKVKMKQTMRIRMMQDAAKKYGG